MSETSDSLSGGDQREGTGNGPGAGKVPGRGRKLPSIFDHLPPGPLDAAALHDATERDLQARALACMDRVAAAGHRTAGPSAP